MSLFADEPGTIVHDGVSTGLWRFHFARRFATDARGPIYLGSAEAANLGGYFVEALDLRLATANVAHTLPGKLAVLTTITEYLLSSDSPRPLLLSCLDGEMLSPAFAAAYLCASSPTLSVAAACESIRDLCADLHTPVRPAPAPVPTDIAADPAAAAAAAASAAAAAAAAEPVSYAEYRVCLEESNPVHAQWIEAVEIWVSHRRSLSPSPTSAPPAPATSVLTLRSPTGEFLEELEVPEPLLSSLTSAAAAAASGLDARRWRAAPVVVPGAGGASSAAAAAAAAAAAGAGRAGAAASARAAAAAAASAAAAAAAAAAAGAGAGAGGDDDYDIFDEAEWDDADDEEGAAAATQEGGAAAAGAGTGAGVGMDDDEEGGADDDGDDDDGDIFDDDDDDEDEDDEAAAAGQPMQ